MVNLPTIDVSQAQADKALAAYGSIPAYKSWLTKAVRDFVIADVERIRDAADVTAKQALIAATLAELP